MKIFNHQKKLKIKKLLKENKLNNNLMMKDLMKLKKMFK